MAVIERIQQVALPEVKATVVDRYFGAASAAPRAVFTRLLRNARHHVRKAKDDSRSEGAARWLDRQLDELSELFDPKNNGFPPHLGLEEQGLFILGYHQQRHWLWLSKEARAELAGGDSTPETELSA
jgi:CRISPR-associated protein Csd1